MQIDLGLLVTVTLFVLSFIGALLMLIYRTHAVGVQRLQDKLDALGELLTAETAARVAKHDESFARVYARVEIVERDMHRVEVSTKKQISDLEVTTAGFGSSYVTRRELEQVREEAGPRRRST